MKGDKISRIIELIGAIGVIASIIYLSIQVNMSNKVAKAELTKDLMLASREAIMNISSDENLGRIWADIGNFNSEDEARKWTFYQSFFRLYELEFNLSKQNLLDESISKSYVLVIKMFSNTKGFNLYWNRAKSTFHKDFVEFVDETISEK